MKESDFLIVGAGMAGTSCGYWLGEKHSVRVLDMEPQPGYHTTGRSVAIYTEAYGPRTVRALAKAGYGFLTAPPQGFSSAALSRPYSWIFVARKDQRQSLERGFREVQELAPQIREISVGEAREMVPVIRNDYLDSALFEPTTLSLDVNAIHQGFIRGIREQGGEIVCNAEAMRFERKGGLWHVETASGVYAAPVIINAAGAWADVVAERLGSRTAGLQPKQRTVIAFTPENVTPSESWPMVIDIDEEFYFKVDAGMVLGSPADETPVAPQDARPDDIDVAVTVDRLERATTMKVGRIRRKWAGLRSFVSDDVPVVGYDPDVEGLFWCAGQGGYGIETCYGLGRTSASLASGMGIPADVAALDVSENDLSPARLHTSDYQ